MKTVSWYSKIIRQKWTEITLSALMVICIGLFTLMLEFFTGRSFEWRSIEPIDPPSIIIRLFYSALVFVTLGSLLYYLGFYKFLYSLYRGTRNGWREYNKIKNAIWGLLILLMFFVIVPTVVNILNAVISFFYNIFGLILYLLPSVGISIFLFGIAYFLRKKLDVV